MYTINLLFTLLFAGACLAAPTEDVVAPEGAIQRIPVINSSSPKEVEATHRNTPSHKLDARFELKPQDPVKVNNGWGGFAAKGQCKNIRMRLSERDLNKFKKDTNHQGAYDDSPLLAADCPDFNRNFICNVFDMTDCITVQEGYLAPSNTMGGNFHKMCSRCEVNDNTILSCFCTNQDTGFLQWVSIDLDDFVHNVNGQMNCLQAHSRQGPEHCPPAWNFQMEDLA